MDFINGEKFDIDYNKCYYEEVNFVMSKMFYRFTFRKMRFTILSKGNKYYGKWNSKMV